MTDLKIFRNIRYATADRFESPKVLPWDGSQHSERGPICPQSPSRLELLQGPQAPMEMDENCQVLSVFTPDAKGKRPVMVFIHGGGFLTGGGELPWHDGDKLAAEQDVVVVTVTYRLAVFGYFRSPSSSGPSLATCDQAAAFQWVKNNISAFGGDPDNVTAFGQSAGGFSIAALIAWGYGGELFQRAILQSGSGGAAMTREDMERTSRLFEVELGQDPLTASVDDLLGAQQRLVSELKRLITWGAVWPEAPLRSAVDIVAGWCKDDYLPFALLEKGVSPAPGSDELYANVTRAGNKLFDGDTRIFAEDIRAMGKNAWLYQFEWRAAPITGLGACHCLDLFFLLGSKEAWQAAPSLVGSSWNEVESHGKRMRKIWADFARGDCIDPQWSNDKVRALPQ